MSIDDKPEPWRSRAACGPKTAHLFDPPTNEIAVQLRLARAFTICRGCPVASQCLDAAYEDKDSGVRAGLLLEDGVPVALPVQMPAKLPQTSDEREARFQEIAKLYACGLGPTAIARELGMTTKAVHNQITRKIRSAA